MNNGIVLHPLKMVYWYIPKVACTTLKTYFADRCGLPYDKSDPMSVHDYCWNHWEKVSKPIPEYFNFAYVRNPFNKLESLYWDKIVNNYSELVFERFGGFYKNMPFDKFCERIIKISHKKADIHFMPQSFLIPQDVNIFFLEIDLLPKILNASNESHKIKKDYLVESMSEDLFDSVFEDYYQIDFDRFGDNLLDPWE